MGSKLTVVDMLKVREIDATAVELDYDLEFGWNLDLRAKGRVKLVQFATAIDKQITPAGITP